MNNTTPITITSTAMAAMISINEVQTIVYIVIAVASLLLTLVTAVLNYKRDGKVNNDDIKNITNKLDDLKEHIDTKEDDK